MNEVPFFFSRGTTSLFGVLHEPTAVRRPVGLVMSHPLAEEKLWSHRVFVSMARQLAADGYPVLRFDYMGAGDSTGRSDEVDLGSQLADLATAVETLATRSAGLHHIGLIGLRLGATVAALTMEAAERGEAPAILRGSPLVLWDPVLDGSAYLLEVLRTNLSAQMATHGKVIETREVMVQRILGGASVNVDGYEIARPLFESVGRVDLLPTTPKRHAGPTLVVPILVGARRKPRPDLEALAVSYPSGTLLEADEQPFWREIKQFYGRAERLQALTRDWLGAQHV